MTSPFGADGPGRERVDAGLEMAWVARARAREVGAFESLYHAHAGRVFALCLRMTGDRVRAGELAHDVFVRAWEHLPGFRGDASFGTWLHRLAVNEVLQARRAERRRQGRVDTANDGEEETRMEFIATDRVTDVATAVDLERAIAQLPPNARMVFILHDVEGYRHGEIGALMGTADGTVRAHLHRARQLLRKMLSR